MIIELILNIVYYLVGLLLTPFQLVFEPLGSFAGLIELLAYASIFIPIPTFSICLGIWLLYHVTKFGVVLVNWIIGKIPTID